jgi:hypothetical protein
LPAESRINRRMQLNRLPKWGRFPHLGGNDQEHHSIRTQLHLRRHVAR